MSPPLTYLPAYLGLFAALLLAVACNAFLDIRYGSFTTEVVLWAAVLAWTLGVGWKQQGQASEQGRQQQKIVLILGAVAFILVFMPLWGFPRAGLYMLLVLQAAQNCVTTSRRQLHLGLLVSLVMVMFAAAHARADWTMLFYLLPYIVAVVFTLVSEQISRRATELRLSTPGTTTMGGQGIAIASATATILFLGLFLYVITPQVTWPYLEWRYGQASNIGFLGKPQEQGKPGQPGQGAGENPPGEGTQRNAGGTGGNAGEQGFEPIPGHAWPSPEQMREAARRPGMPKWQSAAIMQMADLDQALQQALQPMLETLEKLQNKLQEWLKENRRAIMQSLFAALLLALLGVLYFLLREVKVGIWLRTRFDFLNLGLLARHEKGLPGAQQYYRAMERLFALADMPRAPTSNVFEYLQAITRHRDHVRKAVTELSLLFEHSRYARATPTEQQLLRMRQLYRQIFRKLG